MIVPPGSIALQEVPARTLAELLASPPPRANLPRFLACLIAAGWPQLRVQDHRPGWVALIKEETGRIRDRDNPLVTARFVEAAEARKELARRDTVSSSVITLLGQAAPGNLIVVLVARRAVAGFGIFDLATDADVGQRCRACGCTTLRPCEGGCGWVRADLCSTCAGRELAELLTRDRTIRQAAPEGLVWTISATPTAGGWNFQGRPRPLDQLDPGLHNAVRAARFEAVMISISVGDQVYESVHDFVRLAEGGHAPN